MKHQGKVITWTCGASGCTAAPQRVGRIVCSKCGQDFCLRHSTTDPDSLSMDDCYVCFDCWGIGCPWRKLMGTALARYTKERLVLEAEWKAACEKASG